MRGAPVGAFQRIARGVVIQGEIDVDAARSRYFTLRKTEVAMVSPGSPADAPAA